MPIRAVAVRTWIIVATKDHVDPGSTTAPACLGALERAWSAYRRDLGSTRSFLGHNLQTDDDGSSLCL